MIVITRGGGSLEDLLPFSDEGLCRAIAACATVVVSAVGHERDVPLCDLVADARASTPTDAARLIVPDARQELENVDRLRSSAPRAGRARRCACARAAGGARRAARAAQRRLLGRARRGRARRGAQRLDGAPQRARRGARRERSVSWSPACAPLARRRRSSEGTRSCSTTRTAVRDAARARAGRARRPAARARLRPARASRRSEHTRWSDGQARRGTVVRGRARRARAGRAAARGRHRRRSSEALALWERGEALYRACRSRLEAAEARIEKLAEALAEAPPGRIRPRASARRSRPSGGSAGCAAAARGCAPSSPRCARRRTSPGRGREASSTPPSTTAA